MAVLELTDLASIKIMDTSYAQGESDDALDKMIKSVSARVEKFLNRSILIATYTQIFNVKANLHRFSTKAYPVTAVAHLHNLSEVGDTNPIVIDLEFVSFLDNEIGRVSINNNTLFQNFGAVEIEYTGGMATDTADFILNFPDIEQVVIFQILFEMQQVKDLINKGSDIGDQQSERRDWKLLPQVREVLDVYKRKALIV